jgi:hypothetical protein
LDGGRVALELDDLADQLVPADFDEFVHLGAAHVFGHDQRARYLVNLAVFGGHIIEIGVCHCSSFLCLGKFNKFLIDYERT